MKVRELVDILSKCPIDADVEACYSIKDGGGGSSIKDVILMQTFKNKDDPAQTVYIHCDC